MGDFPARRDSKNRVEDRGSRIEDRHLPSSIIDPRTEREHRMLEGVVRFPAKFAARYRAQGYWQDRSLRDTFEEVFERYADRVSIIYGEKSITYAQLNERAARLALNLFDEGFKPLDRVVVQLPNVVEFAYLYFALQKLGCIPIMALPTHRY